VQESAYYNLTNYICDKLVEQPRHSADVRARYDQE